MKLFFILFFFASSACQPAKQAAPEAAAPSTEPIDASVSGSSTNAGAGGTASTGNFNDILAKFGINSAANKGTGGATTAAAKNGSTLTTSATAAKGTVAAPAEGPIKWVKRAWERPIPEFSRHYISNQYSFLSFSLNPLANNEPPFECPFNSFLTGLKGVLVERIPDRFYMARCQFFEDSNKRPVRKGNCSIQKANQDKGSMEFMCPAGTFFAGRASEYMSVSHDRVHYFQCCSMSTEDGKAIDFQKDESSDSGLSCEPEANPREAGPIEATLTVNGGFGPLEMKCTGDHMLRKIYSHYQAQKKTGTDSDAKLIQDRVFSYECCALSVGGAPAPASPAR